MGPDFRRFRTAVLCEGEPDRVPLAEASIDTGIKEAVLGRPIRSAQDEVDFWATAGYDFVPVQTGLRLMTAYGLTGEKEATDERQALLLRNRRIGRARYGVLSDAELRRDWAEEGRGIITSPSLGTPEEVAAEVRRLLREVAPGGGFCLGSGNSVPEYVPLANYQAMRLTCLEWGTYPIAV